MLKLLWNLLFPKVVGGKKRKKTELIRSESSPQVAEAWFYSGVSFYSSIKWRCCLWPQRLCGSSVQQLQLSPTLVHPWCSSDMFFSPPAAHVLFKFRNCLFSASDCVFFRIKAVISSFNYICVIVDWTWYCLYNIPWATKPGWQPYYNLFGFALVVWVHFQTLVGDWFEAASCYCLCLAHSDLWVCC